MSEFISRSLFVENFNLHLGKMRRVNAVHPSHEIVCQQPWLEVKNCRGGNGMMLHNWLFNFRNSLPQRDVGKLDAR